MEDTAAAAVVDESVTSSSSPMPSLPPTPAVAVPKGRKSKAQSRSPSPVPNFELDARLEELLERKNVLASQLKNLGSSTAIPSTSASYEQHEEKTRTLDGAGAHWDYLLKEMSWMSNDFRVERKWKFASAKKLGKELHRAFQKREVTKKREYQYRQAQLKKNANRVAREVKKQFWDKVDRIVLFKNNAEYFAEQQEIMDRNLERLLAQTERYTASLIANSNFASTQQQAKPTENKRRGQLVHAREEKELEELQQLIAEYSNDPVVGKRTTAGAKLKPKKSKRVHLDDEENEDEDEDDESFAEEEEEEEEEEDIDEEDEANPEDDGNEDALENDLEIPLEELMRQRDAAIAAEVAEGDNHEVGSDSSSNSEEEEDDDEEEEESESNDQQQPETFPNQEDASMEIIPHDAPAQQFSVSVPFLLSKSRPLRAYQREGLDWLVSLYDRHLNGILADEMGLGKTAQTIALLAHLASARGVWGPHLVIVPTSVILNWDLEFKTWCPGLKVLTYFGTAQERAAKRAGWTKPNAFHVCVTSYQLAVQDASVFKRKKWIYLIADEAHNLKNSKSQRWQTLLSFQAKRRLLITGTPLQNSLMELWSLMHFLMPHVFRSQHEFRHWFSNPLQAIVESTESKTGASSAAVKRLHAIMRPFILRRLKQDVASQLPSKHEHIVRFPLARRQRMLYEEFVNLKSTQDSLTSGGYMGMMSVLMKLRMCCNHPDLFEPRLIASSFCVDELEYKAPRCAFALYGPVSMPSLVDFRFADAEFAGSSTMQISAQQQSKLAAQRRLDLEPNSQRFQDAIRIMLPKQHVLPAHVPDQVRQAMHQVYLEQVQCRRADKQENVAMFVHHNSRRLQQSVPIFGAELTKAFTVTDNNKRLPSFLYLYNNSFEQQVEDMSPVLQRFVFVTPAAKGTVRTPLRSSNGLPLLLEVEHANPPVLEHETMLRQVAIRQQISFPDKYLLQYDSGKLQTLAIMLHRLKQGKHRVLIFTQMTKMLDLLERFLNLHSHTYFRLDGSTKVEDRQSMMERFNRDSKVFCFILSTRSGGLGINLTGADTVIFFDSDWNPQMDAQATDRAHRIGQTREVHIYRLIAEQTVEENILLKSNQKRHLSRLSVEEGNFTGGIQQQEDEEQTAMALVEDETDQLATLRAKQEEEELEKGDNEDVVPTGSAGGGEKKIEDEQGNVLMTVQQYRDMESKLLPVDMYAMEFRQQYAVVVDKLKEARRQKELDRQAEMSAQQEEDWEIDKLEHERQLAEEEAEEEAIQSNVMPEWEAELFLQSKRRAFKLERKLRKMTGRAWKKTFCKQLHKDGKSATTTELAYYLNEDTGETAWERPAVLDYELERKQTRLGGFAWLPQSVLARIARFLPQRNSFRMVCLQWWRAGDLACWIGPRFTLTVGTRVEVKEDANKESSHWFAGTICDVSVDGQTCAVMYADGTVSRDVEWSRVRADTGARLTIIRSKKPGGPVFEVYNPTLASRFAGGTPALHPEHCDSLALAKNYPVIVLPVGKMQLTKFAFARSQRIVGEAFFARERGWYLLAEQRIVRDDLYRSNQAGFEEISVVDCVAETRMSCIIGAVMEWTLSVANQRIRVDGIVFASTLHLTCRADGGRFVFRDCVFQRGLSIGERCMASFEGCQIMGNANGPGAYVANQATALFSRCRFAGNVIGLQAAASARTVSLSGCEIVPLDPTATTSLSPPIVGPVTLISLNAVYGVTTVPFHFVRPQYGPLALFTRKIKPVVTAIAPSHFVSATKKRASTAAASPNKRTKPA